MSAKTTSAATESVLLVRNTERRPIAFRLPGRTCRLGPGQSVELPIGSDASQELACLLQQRKLQRSLVHRPKPAALAPSVGDDKARGSKPQRSAVPKGRDVPGKAPSKKQ